MKALGLALAFAVSLVVVAPTVSAQSLTTDIGVSVKVTQTQTCQFNGACEGVQKSAFSINQSFEISPTQVAQINGSTKVSVTGGPGVTFDVLVGDDPNYQVGDESATIDTTVDIIGNSTDAQVKLSWKNGIFTVSAKGNGTVSIATIPVSPGATTSSIIPGAAALPPANPLGTVPQAVSLEDAGGVFATTTGYAAAQIIQNIKGTPIANSAMKVQVLVSVKSKYQVAEPL